MSLSTFKIYKNVSRSCFMKDLSQYLIRLIEKKDLSHMAELFGIDKAICCHL